MDYPKSYPKRPLWQWFVIYLIIGGFIYFAIFYLFFSNKSRKPYGAAYNPNVSQTATENAILITASGFQSASITIKAGMTVTWMNNSGNNVSLNSSPHPTHTDYPPLNIGIIKNGASASLTFPTPGVYKYHNHLDASQYGSITVQ